jgi:hypothetical protein
MLLRDVFRSIERGTCPTLQDSEIGAALAYAAELAREGTIDLSLEIKA